MKKLIFIFTIFLISLAAEASIKEKIIKNLQNTNNLAFNFEQNTNGKIETGNCTIEYPKKIFCSYNLANEKIMVSNGKSLIIKTKNGGYYRYPIKKTPLDFILDKKFLLNEIKNLEVKLIDNKFVNFTIFKNENKINIFFDKTNFNLIGWQTIDIYQNLNITYLSSIIKNQILKNNLFKLPETN